MSGEKAAIDYLISKKVKNIPISRQSKKMYLMGLSFDSERVDGVRRNENHPFFALRKIWHT